MIVKDDQVIAVGMFQLFQRFITVLGQIEYVMRNSLDGKKVILFRNEGLVGSESFEEGWKKTGYSFRIEFLKLLTWNV